MSGRTLRKLPFLAHVLLRQDSTHAESSAVDVAGFLAALRSAVSKEKADRIAWEQTPPLSPRGSLVQAREDLELSRKQISYWNAPLRFEVPRDAEGLEGHNANAYTLEAIREESEDEASLKRANSLSSGRALSRLSYAPVIAEAEERAASR